MFFPASRFYSSRPVNEYYPWKSFFSEACKYFKKSKDTIALNTKTPTLHLIIFFSLILNGFVFYGSIFSSAAAGQGHQDCSMCHGVHSAKDLALFPEPINNFITNPHTGKNMDKIDALCMKCHARPPYGKGIKEIDPNNKHPFGIKPFLVSLPDQAHGFGGQTECLSCMGCHDPHPSNQNIGYLRAPSGIKISKTEDVIKSCIWCHPKMKTVFDFIPQNGSKALKSEKKSKPIRPPPVGGITF
jgi:hypothetical protein